MKPETSDDRVLIKPIEADKITKGGIYIPDSAREFERKKTGIVICHGKGYVDQQTGELFPITVWEGCKVSFPAHLGEEFQGRDIGMEEGIYLLINERDIDVIICDYGFDSYIITYTKEQMEQMKDYRENGMQQGVAFSF